MSPGGFRMSTQFDCEIFDAKALRVFWGINEGDPLGPPDLLCSGDVYTLSPDACPLTVAFDVTEDAVTIPDGVPCGPVTVLAELRLMAQDNELFDALLIDVAGEPIFCPCPPCGTAHTTR